MASFIDKMTVNSAITDNTKLDLGHSHITTANFMQLNPVLCKEMVPGEKVDVNMMTFARMQPLAVPTFGRANIKERAFFVPMRTIFRGWNDFITDTPHVYSGAKEDGGVNYPTVPTISNAVLAQFFVRENVILPVYPGGILDYRNYVVATDVTSSIGTQNPRPYDIVGYRNATGDVGAKYMRLTTEGKQCLKVIESLGYKIVFDERNTDVYSALPLLALAKVYCDWYFPSQYVNTGIYAAIMGLLNYDGASSLQLTLRDLTNIMTWITYVNFDSDYFVNAWDNPVAPSQGVYSQFTLMDVSMPNGNAPVSAGGGVGYGDTAGDWFLTAGSSSSVIRDFRVGNVAVNGTPTTLQTLRVGSTDYSRIGMSVSDYAHKALTALTDYMKRHQLVGARAMDRYLARFGKTLNSEQLNRCNYIGSKMVPLQIGDVMSTTSTSPTGDVYGLGQFAGKGMAIDEGFRFDWSTNEYGYLIVTSSIVPAAGIYQGLDRTVMHIGRTDFWTPEFDNLGVQAISTRELYNNYDYTNLSTSYSSYMGFNDSVFGFAPRYGEYKYAKDQLTGDFVCSSIQPLDSNASENAWHLYRTFDDNDFKDANNSYSFGNLVHSRMFMQGLVDHLQFNRIFNYTEEVYTPDPITMVYNFDMVSFAPMKPLYETYEFEDKGQKVQEQAGGVKVN